MAKFGLLALACYGIHGCYHLFHGHPGDLLWACHIGAAILGLGLLLHSATINAIGTLFLCLGTPLWLLDISHGGEFVPTSCFTHLGALAIGLYGVRRLGLPRRAWWLAALSLVGLMLLCRLITPERANVNVAFAIQHGWEGFFSSHPSYLATMIALATAYFFLLTYALRCWLTAKTASKVGIRNGRVNRSTGPAP